MLACDERGFIWLPRRRPAGCLVPCIICGQPLENESAGNNQPVGGLAFECGGHWPRAVFDAEPGWLEINICEPCLHRAANGRRILPGDHASRRSPAVYKSCNGRNRSDRDLPRDLPSRDDGLEPEGPLFDPADGSQMQHGWLDGHSFGRATEGLCHMVRPVGTEWGGALATWSYLQ